MGLDKREYSPTFLNMVNRASLHELKNQNISLLGRYVFTPDIPLDDLRQEFEEPEDKPKLLARMGAGLKKASNAIKGVFSKQSTSNEEYTKDNSKLADPKKAHPDFKLPHEKNEVGQRTMFQLWQHKNHQHDSKTYAVFNTTSNPLPLSRKKCLPIDYALNLFYKHYNFEHDDYIKPDKLLIPVYWQYLDDDQKVQCHQALIEITPDYTSFSAKLKSSSAEIVIHGDKSIDESIEASHLKLIDTLENFSNEPAYSEDFSLSGAPWINKNIRTIIQGGTPNSKNDVLDTHLQYGYYYQRLGYPKIAKFFQQSPPSTWQRYKSTLILIGVVLLLGVIMAGFACGFPGAFSSLIYGGAALFNISSTAIGVLSLAQIAFITAAVVSTLSAALITVVMAVKSGFAHLKERVATIKQAKQIQHPDIILPPVSDSLANVNAPNIKIKNPIAGGGLPKGKKPVELQNSNLINEM